MKISIFLLFISVLLFSCGGYSEFQNKATSDYSDAQMQKFAKYMIQGKSLYNTHCSNCHQTDGSGLGKVYPPLKNSDYLLEDKARAVCLVKNGISEPIIVNGVNYSQAMPGNQELSNLEIAELITYVYNSFGHEEGMIDLENVERALNSCSN